MTPQYLVVCHIEVHSQSGNFFHGLVRFEQRLKRQAGALIERLSGKGSAQGGLAEACNDMTDVGIEQLVEEAA